MATHEDEFALVPLDPLIDVAGSDDPALLNLAAEHYEAYAANIQVELLLLNYFLEYYGLLWY